MIKKSHNQIKIKSNSTLCKVTFKFEKKNAIKIKINKN